MPSHLGPRIPIHPGDRHRLCQPNEGRCPVQDEGDQASTHPDHTPAPTSAVPSSLGPRIPIHPSDRLLLHQETGSRRPIKNGNDQASTQGSSPRTPPLLHITDSSSSSALIPHTPINLTVRGGYSPTLSGNDTPSSATHHALHPFEDKDVSFFSSTRGLLDYDLANDTWVQSAAALTARGQGRGAARVVGQGLVTETGTMRFLPWYGRLLAATQQQEEEEAELRWARERMRTRRGRMSGRYVNETGAGEEVGEVDGALEEAREADGVEDEVEDERGQKRDTSVEESEERRKISAEDWERREGEREKIEALLAAEGSGVENKGNGLDDENPGFDLQEGKPGPKRRRKN